MSFTGGYSTNLKIALFGNGDTPWGDIANANLGDQSATAGGVIEQAISGYIQQAVADSNSSPTTLTIPNGYDTTTVNATARNMYLELSSSSVLTAPRSLVVPTNKKLYFIYNNTSGGQAVTVRTPAGVGVSVPNGKRMALVCNGTDIVDAVTYITGVALNPANPSGLVGPTAVNGTALTYMRSDAAPAINLTADFTWTTGTHTFNGAIGGSAFTAYFGNTPPNIGTGTPATGTFTTLKGNQAYTSPVAISSAAAFTLNCALSNVFVLTMTNNVSNANWTISNPVDGQTINLFIIQGSGPYTLGWPTSFKFPGGSTGVAISTTNGYVDLLVMTYRSGVWYCTLSKNFS